MTDTLGPHLFVAIGLDLKISRLKTLQCASEQENSLANIEERLQLAKGLLINTPTDRLIDSPESLQGHHSVWAYHIAAALCHRYQYLSSASDLDEAIQLLRPVVEETINDQTLKAEAKCVLGHALRRRSQETGSTQDFQEAYNLHSSLHESCPSTELHPRVLCELSHTLLARFHIDGSLDDLTTSIQLAEYTVDLTFDSKLQEIAFHAKQVLATGLFQKIQRGDKDVSLLHRAFALC